MGRETAAITRDTVCDTAHRHCLLLVQHASATNKNQILSLQVLQNDKRCDVNIVFLFWHVKSQIFQIHPWA